MGNNKKKPDGYWNNYKKCKKAVLSCKSRTELHSKYSSAYKHIFKNNWRKLFELLIHRNSWTYETCKKEASKYRYRKDIARLSGGAYAVIRKNGWDKKLFKHMLPLGNLKKRLIYVYEFSDKSCYVGLTGNIEKRNISHTEKNTKCTVYKHIKKGFSYILIEKTKYIDVKKAIIQEGVTVKKYKKNGWTILNKRKTGGIGAGYIKYTFKICLDTASKYKTKKDFIKNEPKLYNSAIEHNFIDNIYKKLKWKKNVANGFWTLARCKKEAKRFKNLNKFVNNSKSCYWFAFRNGFLKSITKHMKKLKKGSGYWTIKMCIKEVKKHKSKTSFSTKSKGAYNACRRNGWLQEIWKNLNS